MRLRVRPRGPSGTSPWTFGYDPVDLQVRPRGPSGTSPWTFGYDPAGLRVRPRGPSGTTPWAFGYDPVGLRVRPRGPSGTTPWALGCANNMPALYAIVSDILGIYSTLGQNIGRRRDIQTEPQTTLQYRCESCLSVQSRCEIPVYKEQAVTAFKYR